MTEYLFEKISRGRRGSIYAAIPLNEVIYVGRSKYQEIIVADTSFGKTLILDGVLQLTEEDEEVYHKALVEPAFKRDFRRILILGGGDGGAARELLRLKDDIEIDVVDIDPMVTKIVGEYLPSVSGNVFKDDRVRLHNMDAYQYVMESSGRYDYVIMDLTDIREEGEKGDQVNRFYRREFLGRLRQILTDNGILVSHVALFPLDHRYIKSIIGEASMVFKNIIVYATYIPSFGGLWCFMALSDNEINLKIDIDGLIYPDRLIILNQYLL